MPTIQSKLPPQPVKVGNQTLYTSTKTSYEVDSNGFAIPATVKHELYSYPSATATTGVLQATSSGNSNNWTYPSSSNLTPEQKNSLKSGNLNNAALGQIKNSASSLSSSEQQKLISKPNTATNNPNENSDNDKQNGENNSNLTDEQKNQAKEEAGTYKENTRTSSYGELMYPITLKSESQDCVRFSILEYVPSLAGAKSGGDFALASRDVFLQSSKFPVVKGAKRLGTITLPIPGGISDSNAVNWQNDDINELQKFGAQVAQEFMSTGSAESSLAKGASDVTAATKSGDLETAVKGFFGQAVTGANIGGRAYGVAFNNNTELIFTSPSLRTFSFRFLFSPRSEEEAKMIMKIIRAFKQSMAVKRSKTSLLLKAPRTFAISYTTSQNGKLVQHPYLNRFKECALTSCNVDYTPDGSYMTYWSKNADGRSMTSYTLTLQFQELVPIFDDEYGAVDQNKDTFIGY